MAAEMVARDQPNSCSKGTMSTLAVARMATADPGLNVLAAPFGAEVAGGDRGHELDSLRFGQPFDCGVTDDADYVIGPFNCRDRQRGAAVLRHRASFICGGRARDQELVVAVIKPDRKYVRVAVEAVESELPDDRPPEELSRAGVHVAIFMTRSA